MRKDCADHSRHHWIVTITVGTMDILVMYNAVFSKVNGEPRKIVLQYLSTSTCHQYGTVVWTDLLICQNYYVISPHHLPKVIQLFRNINALIILIILLYISSYIVFISLSNMYTFFDIYICSANAIT